MKIMVFSLFVILLIFISFFSQAQLDVCDDFRGPFLDRYLWRYNTSWGTYVWPYEGGFRILKKKLNFFNRAYGGDKSDAGTQDMRRRLFLRDVAGVTSTEASVRVMKNSNEITGII